MNQDVIYNILLQSDLTSIKQLCSVNTVANKLCKDQHFWTEKLNKNGYLIDKDMPKTLKSYENIDNIDKKVNQMIKDARYYDSYMIFYFNDENLNIVLPTKLLNMSKDNAFDAQTIKIENRTLTYTLYDEDEIEAYTIRTNTDTIKKLLVKILYYYPKVSYIA